MVLQAEATTRQVAGRRRRRSSSLFAVATAAVVAVSSSNHHQFPIGVAAFHCPPPHQRITASSSNIEYATTKSAVEAAARSILCMQRDAALISSDGLSSTTSVPTSLSFSDPAPSSSSAPGISTTVSPHLSFTAAASAAALNELGNNNYAWPSPPVILDETPATTTTASLSAPSRQTSTSPPAPVHNYNFFPLAPSTSSTYHHQQLVLDPDGIRRRQLLFTMIGTWTALYSSSPTRSETPVAQAAEVSNTTTSTTINDPVSVIKSPLDDREYKALTLSNGLRVLLCSDPSSSDAGAAMDVHVGAMSDPFPGLAHFNEHMLFLGTKPYPKEDSFESFLASNGGISNAFTDSENTVYFFDMQSSAGDSKLAEGLSRFAAFFTAPLFSESATGRELNAIESENAKNLQSDTFRIFQLLKARANVDHPFSKFFTGNKATLLDQTKQMGLDLRTELMRFYESYYSANQMTLAVVGPQPLDSLETMVSQAFGKIPNKNIPKPEVAWAGKVLPFGGENSIVPAFQHIVEVVPVQDLRQVTIAWPLIYESIEDTQESLLIKPSNYVAHLLGHEGPRSLLSYLKRQGWANSIACGNEESVSDFETFEVVVGLTSQGLVAVNEVIEAVYSYLSLMHDRSIPSYVFEEVLQLDELSWRFLTKSNNLGGYLQSLATAMQKYPPELYVAGPRRLAVDSTTEPLTNAARTGFASVEQLDRTRQAVERVVEHLTVDNAMITILSKTFEGQTDRVEKWYGTEYRARPVPPLVMAQWQHPVRASKIKIDFPKPNPFLPSESGLAVKKEPLPHSNKYNQRTFESRMEPIEPPRVIRDDGPGGRWTVYFKQDDCFGQPKAFIIFQILTKEVFASARLAALSNIFEISASDKLEEYAYDASLAGLSYDVKVLPRGVRLTFGGYNDKLREFAAYVSKKVSRDLNDILPKNDKDFDRYKDQIMRALSAFDAKQPYAHASYYGQLTLQPRKFQYDNKELIDATRKITLPDLVEYVNMVWSSGKGEALVQGNFGADEALGIVKTIGDAIPFRPIPESELPPRLEALPLPTSGVSTRSTPTLLVVAEPNSSNENSVSYVLLQSLGKSERDHVMLELLSSIISEPFYNELRTKRQLGYIVSSGIRGIGESRTLAFIVQSSIATADRLTAEILDFLDHVDKKILEKVSKADLAVYIKSQIDRKTEPDKDLISEVTRNWSEISSGRLQFDRIQKEAASLLEVEKQDVLDFWRQIYAGAGRRVLVTEVIPRRGVAASATPPTTTGYTLDDLTTEGLVLGVDDIEQFRRDREPVSSMAFV